MQTADAISATAPAARDSSPRANDPATVATKTNSDVQIARQPRPPRKRGLFESRTVAAVAARSTRQAQPPRSS